MSSAHAAPGRRHPDAHPPVAGRYVLLDQVGAGGMGSVWRARDTRTGELVAVKVLGSTPPACSPASSASRRSGCGTRTSSPRRAGPPRTTSSLLAMDLVPGGSVQQLLDEHGPLPAGTPRGWSSSSSWRSPPSTPPGWCTATSSRPTCSSTPDRHGRRDPHLRLGDFGVAAPIADRRFTTVPGAIGTDGYMAPEQARGAPPDPCQDLYAAGRVGLQLLTGLPPSRQGGIGSSRLRPLLERLLVVDPEQRLASAEAALRLLRRLDIPAEPGPVVVDRLPPLPAGGVPARRRLAGAGPPSSACLGVLVACAVVAAAALT